MADAFECAVFVRERSPDAIGEWSERDREASYRARDRLLLDRPGRAVVSERSYCMDHKHDRWPDEATQRGFTHALVYEVTLG